MGYSCCMKIFALCPLRTFLEENQKNFIFMTREDKLFQKYLPCMRELYSDTLNKKLEFFKTIKELTITNFQLKVSSERLTNKDSDSDDDEFEELYDYEMNNFVTCFFFEILLEAIDTNDTDIGKYFKILRDFGDITFKKNGICKIHIFSASSYKGSEKLDIDYFEVCNSINELKLRIPFVEIKTTLRNSY